MSADVQLRLLSSHRVLTERFGAAFFRGIPAAPGVYYFDGDHGRLLYVGKAGNLRQRLGSYRHTDTASRKTRRLVACVRAIRWEVCATEEAAALRENHLIRTERPRFNRAGVWPQANAFVGRSVGAGCLQLRIVRDPALPVPATDARQPSQLVLPAGPGDAVAAEDTGNDTGNGWRLFGSFKPRVNVAMAALVRLLWSFSRGWPGFGALPRGLLPPHTPREFQFDLDATQARPALDEYLEGKSSGLLTPLSAWVEALPAGFERCFWESDLAELQGFYTLGPERNRALRAHFGVAGPLIGPAELDDLLVRWRRRQPDAQAEGRGVGVTGEV